MLRLEQWEWRGMGLKHPRIVGHYTADVVYQRLAPSLLEELMGYHRTHHCDKETRAPKTLEGYGA
jgi:hypothetical protein